MKIAVCSALHGQGGVTTSALFVAHSLALTQNQFTLLTHADFGHKVLFRSLGLEPVADVTRSLSHVAMMLRTGMLKPEDVPDYATRVFDGLDLYSADKATIETQELLTFYEYLLSKMTVYRNIVMDVDGGIRADISSLMLSVSDVIILPISHNIDVIEAGLEFRDEILRTFAKSRHRRSVRLFFLLNHYDSYLDSYKSVAAKLGVKSQRLLTLHENKELIKAMNTGKVSDSFANAVRGAPKMLPLRTDMKVLTKALFGKDAIWSAGKGAK